MANGSSLHRISIIKFLLTNKKCKSISISYDSAIPGIIIAILIATTVSDPAKDKKYEILMGNIDDDDDDDGGGDSAGEVNVDEAP